MNTLATTVTPYAEKIGVPLLVALIGLAGTLGTAALASVFGRISEAAARRREGYAEATKELLAWAEYPYRIRRRTSDTPATLTALADLGHDLQQALRYREAWINAENQWVANVFTEVRTALTEAIGPCCNDAWSHAPIGTASEMNLNGWGPNRVDEELRRFEHALRFRFGWRRLAGFFRWHPDS